MVARWHPRVILATLHNGANGSAIDLEVEPQIPSKIWCPQDNKMRPRLSAGSSDRDNPSIGKNQKHSADVISQAAHALIVA